MNSIVTFILEMRKLKLNKIKSFVQGPTKLVSSNNRILTQNVLFQSGDFDCFFTIFLFEKFGGKSEERGQVASGV